MCDVPYVMGKRYAEALESIWFTYLYATLIPFGAFLTFIGLGTYYWVDKVNLLRRSSRTENISGKLAIKTLRMLDITLILPPIGAMIFDSQIRDGWDASSIVFICVAFVYIVLPMNDILEYFHEEKFELDRHSYTKIKHKFNETYMTLNPLSSRSEKIYTKLHSKIDAQAKIILN
jgi:hypothetical protein